jgi:hypothetical protein
MTAPKRANHSFPETSKYHNPAAYKGYPRTPIAL